MSGRRSSDRPRVAVGDMTRLLYCETQSQLRFKYGKRTGSDNARASARSVREHDAHDRNTRRYHQQPAVSDPRCFVATAVYGCEAWQLSVFRAFRDTVLLRGRAGRRMVQFYYWASPPIARAIGRVPWCRRIVRRGLDRVAIHLLGMNEHWRG